jgi:pyridoxal phosphate enzyme (YggS family)
MSIIENYSNICDKVKNIAEKTRRNPEDIKIVAVSKTFSSTVIQEAIDQGLALFGENKVQEAKRKIQELHGNFIFHLVGHLQSNKARDAVQLFDLIHSIDKVSTADKVNTEAGKINKIQKTLVQINTSGEDTKSGIAPNNAIDFIKEINVLKNIEILGLMTIGPFTNDKNRIRESFRTLRIILHDINNELNANMKELSMGMSSDYDIAVEEGSTMLRIGTAIFGKRDYSE